MIKVSIVHLHVTTLQQDYDPETEAISGSFDECAKRFVDTYKQFDPGYPHELVVVFSNESPKNLEIYDGISIKPFHYKGTGWCSGAHQFAAERIDSDFAVFNSARTHFWKAGWLRKIMDAREKYGQGFYATMSSAEGCPHLRTNCYCCDPTFFRTFEHKLDSRPASRILESGEWNVSDRYHSNGFPSKLVTWDGVYSKPDWRKPENIFRRGDQSNCLVWDRHTEIYAKASDEEKCSLELLTDPE